MTSRLKCVLVDFWFWKLVNWKEESSSKLVVMYMAAKVLQNKNG